MNTPFTQFLPDEQASVHKIGFNSLDDLKQFAKSAGYLDVSGGLHAIPGYYYPDNGIRLKNNIISAYTRCIVNANPNAYLLEEQIYAPAALYEASGHLANFHDPACRCEACGARHRADHLVEERTGEDCASKSVDELNALIADLNCPLCGGALSDVRPRSLMAELKISSHDYYLAPETAQHIFLHYKDGLRNNRNRLPFSLHQVNLASRGEVTMDIRRRRMFTQMEEELFYLASKSDTQQLHREKIEQYWDFFIADLGIAPGNLRLREHTPEERSHYSSATTDIEAKVGKRWLEIAGFAHRGSFDLANMQRLSGQNLAFDGELPEVIEPSVGLDRLMLAILESAYRVELVAGKERTVLKLHPNIAPYTALVTPLIPRDAAQYALAQKIDRELRLDYAVLFDDTRSVGRRYRRADQLGVPYAVTVDELSTKNGSVTVRERDSMQQQRIAIDEVATFIRQSITNYQA